MPWGARPAWAQPLAAKARPGVNACGARHACASPALAAQRTRRVCRLVCGTPACSSGASDWVPWNVGQTAGSTPACTGPCPPVQRSASCQNAGTIARKRGLAHAERLTQASMWAPSWWGSPHPWQPEAGILSIEATVLCGLHAPLQPSAAFLQLVAGAPREAVGCPPSPARLTLPPSWRPHWLPCHLHPAAATQNMNATILSGNLVFCLSACVCAGCGLCLPGFVIRAYV